MVFSLKRGEILRVIKDNEPISITSLAKRVNLSTGNTIYRYIKELEEKGLINTSKDEKKRGQPTMLRVTDKARPLIKSFFSMSNQIKDVFE